jgi:large subunit ribosomal protein L4
MLIDLYLKDGTKNGQVEVSDDVFAVEPNEHAMHTAVVVYLAHQRQGTAKTKVRHEVRGGGRKPWRQKGRGTARAGSTRSPIWVHGGTIHGPKPRDYDVKMTKKMSRLAKRSALSVRAAENNVILVDDFKLDEIKTKLMAEVLKNLELANEKVLILLPENNPELYLAARNIPKVAVQEAAKITTYDILNYKKLLLFKSAVESLQNACIN